MPFTNLAVHATILKISVGQIPALIYDLKSGPSDSPADSLAFSKKRVFHEET